MILETLPPADEGARLVGRDPAPDGYHFEWFPEDDVAGKAWAVVDNPRDRKPCRFSENRTTCKAPSVAKLHRGGPPGREWWHYCADHLYGRVISAGRVWNLRLVEGAPEGASS